VNTHFPKEKKKPHM